MPSDELSGNELALAVAVKLGFKLDPDGKTGVWPNGGMRVPLRMIPGFDWDLNAMHEVERTYVIPRHLALDYVRCIDGDFHASATQRARAFLKLR